MPIERSGNGLPLQMKKSLAASLLIYSLVFWLWRLPFLIWLPIPEFGPDAFDYFALVKALRDKTPLTYSIDLPLGFPAFVYFATLISSKALFILCLQFLLKYCAGLFLIYTCWKYYRWQAVLVSIILSVYITDSISLRYDTCFIPDSLYNSFLLTTIALLIHSVKAPAASTLALLSVSMFLVAFTRSNGFFIYCIIPLMLPVLLPDAQRVWKYSALIIPALLLHATVFSLKTSSEILYTGNNRINEVISRETQSLEAASGKSYLMSKFSLAKEYVLMNDVPSYYFSLLPERYRQLYVYDQIHDPGYKMFDWTTAIPDDLRRFVYREYYEQPSLLKQNQNMMDISFAYSNPWFMMIHLLYKIQSIIFRNLLWHVAGVALMIAGVRVYFKSAFTDKDAWLLFVLPVIHFASLLVVVIGHGAMQYRYSHVTEFLLYLAPVFLLMIILPSRSESKN